MQEQQKKNCGGAVLIILAGVCWGLIGLFSAHLAEKGCTPVQITFVRSMVTAVALWCYLLLFKREALKISLKDLWMFLGTGVLSIVFFNIMYFITIERTTLSVAAILLYTAPCFVMMMSAVFFHEKIDGKKIGALILAMVGCVCTTGILGGQTGRIPVSGIFTGLCSGIGYALYTIFGNIALKKYAPVTVTAYTFLTASLSLLPFVSVKNLLAFSLDGSFIFYTAAIGLISTLLPFALYTAGLKRTEPGRASVMAFVEPMVATMVSIFILKEGFSWMGMAGVLAIFISIVLLNLPQNVRMRTEDGGVV